MFSVLSETAPRELKAIYAFKIYGKWREADPSVIIALCVATFIYLFIKNLSAKF